MSQFGWHDCPISVRTQVENFTGQITTLLTGNLVGIYLHGSLAMACFNPQHSDLDLLVITHTRIPAAIKRQLAELHLSASNTPHPIEISYLPHSDLVPWRYPPPFDCHYSEAWREKTEQALQDQRWPQADEPPMHDPDLAAHVTITKARGICLYGAPIAQIFPAVPKADYLASILGDVNDAFDNILDNPVYAILNACRVDAFLHAGRICSKQEGGEWALARAPSAVQPAITAALTAYAANQTDIQFDSAAVATFVAYMRQRLASAG